MTKIVFSVFDSKTVLYSPPMLAHSRGEAVRLFLEAASDPRSMLAKHPDDFSVHELATFDDNSGKFENLPIYNIGTVSSLQPRPNVSTEK